MKRICSFSIIHVIILVLISALNISCDKEVDPKLLPVLTTTEVIKMTEATAYSGGNITSDAGSDVTSRGVCWSESPNPTIEENKTIDAAGTGVFESRIIGLNSSTTYYVRAYAVNKKGVAYGLQVTFKTKTLTITTSPITATTISSAVSGGTLESDGDSLNVFERGICWNSSTNPTIANSKIASGKGKGKYSGLMSELQIATQYFVRAYVTNVTGTFYGDEVSFITTNGSMTLTTTAATSITAISATIGGSVPNDGGATVTERGFCISKLPNPTITNKIANGNGVGSFASNITGLEANTTYYVRVFATNSVGTAYGNEISFTTKDGIVVLTTSVATSITATSATTGGNISNDGGAAISARGLCWSTTPNPTIANPKSTNTGGVGTFATNITGLNIGATYYIRAYATNSVGTSYGNEVSFTTLDGTIILTTTNISAITAYTASCGGNISSDGGGVTVNARGVCWSTTSNPTINDNKTLNGANIGVFNSSITGLTLATTYYLRAYATNSVGTFYGNEVNFTTQNGNITLVTSNLNLIMLNSVSCSGSITSDGGGVSITDKGFCYSLTSNPTINDSKTRYGNGIESFTSSITNLLENSRYYVRAFATNIVGTFYGNELEFTTLPPNGGIVTDVDGNIYHTVTIGTQVWLAENLKTTKYRDGTTIPNVSINSLWSNLTTGAYCDYNNTQSNSNIYGKLYNWHAVADNHNIAPIGWHVPTDSEWTTLINYLGGESIAGGKLKEIETTHWAAPNLGATNETSFTGLPGGYRSDINSSFNLLNSYGGWWSNTQSNTNSSTNYAWYRSMNYNESNVGRGSGEKKRGYSIRCIRD